MGKTSKRLGIVATAVVACAGIMTVAAPVAEAKTGLHDRVGQRRSAAQCRAGRTASPRPRTMVRATSSTNGVATLGGGPTSSQKTIVSALERRGQGIVDRSQGAEGPGRPRRRRRRARSPTTISTAVGNTAEVFFDAKVTRRRPRRPTEPAKYQAKIEGRSPPRSSRDSLEGRGGQSTASRRSTAGGELDTATQRRADLRHDRRASERAPNAASPL